jgi:hypothetical protein
MITEEELRDRLHSESVGLEPRGDLLESLAEGHARKHRRARMGVVGGSIAATALVVTLLGGLLSNVEPAPIDPATLSDREIIEQAQRADAGARGRILHLKTTVRTPTGEESDMGFEAWAVRSGNQGRVVRSHGNLDTVVGPDGMETIDHGQRTVTTFLMPITDALGHIVPALGWGEPDHWLDDSYRKVMQLSLSVRRDGTEIHLFFDRDDGLRFDLVIDPKTYLPVTSTVEPRTGAGQRTRTTYEWLPATAANRKLMEHSIPPGYEVKTTDMTRRDGPQPGGPPRGSAPVHPPGTVLPSK